MRCIKAVQPSKNEPKACHLRRLTRYLRNLFFASALNGVSGSSLAGLPVIASCSHARTSSTRFFEGARSLCEACCQMPIAAETDHSRL